MNVSKIIDDLGRKIVLPSWASFMRIVPLGRRWLTEGVKCLERELFTCASSPSGDDAGREYIKEKRAHEEKRIVTKCRPLGGDG